MKKFLDNAADVVDDALAGFACAHAELVKVSRAPVYVTRVADTPDSKVALVSGGGSGHEPMHIGFVGHGMLDAACPGAVFTSPSPDQILAAMAACNTSSGVLLLVKNYDGDLMNFEMAAEMAAEIADTACRIVVISDDAACPDAAGAGRGIAGTVLVEKLVGALAERGADLARCEALGNRINRMMRSFGVALSSCTVPALGESIFAIGDNEVEWGVGIHGERGRQQSRFGMASEMAADMIDTITAALPASTAEDVLLLTNGLGATPLTELYLMHNLAQARLAEKGLRVTRSLVGNFCTSLDTAGCSFTVLRLDRELVELWDAPVVTAALTR